MQDSIEITLPVSGKKVVIRNYTTEADDEKAESILYLGVLSKQEMLEAKKSGTGKMNLEFPIANMMASQKSYIPRLVQSIDDDTSNIALRLKDLRSEDFAVVREAVEQIVEEHSPKAKKGSGSSKSN